MSLCGPEARVLRLDPQPALAGRRHPRDRASGGVLGRLLVPRLTLILGKVVTQGVPVVAARRLPSMLRALPAVLGPERIANLADQARVRFHAAA